jgi:hypothetical protein
MSAQKRQIKILKFLHENEWTPHKVADTDPEYEYFCPACEAHRSVGHDPECWIAELIKKLEHLTTDKLSTKRRNK